MLTVFNFKYIDRPTAGVQQTSPKRHKGFASEPTFFLRTLWKIKFKRHRPKLGVRSS